MNDQPPPTPRPWLDLSADELAAAISRAARALSDAATELVAMEGALEALERHPEAATAREACALDSPMFRALVSL